MTELLLCDGSAVYHDGWLHAPTQVVKPVHWKKKEIYYNEPPPQV